MHASLFVIGDNPEEQLAPFDEQLEVEPYRQPISDESAERMMTHYADSIPFGSPPEAYRDVAIDWGNWESFDRDEDGYFRMSTNNKRGKWDWFEIGGRWRGEIIDACVGSVNQSKAGHILWSAMRVEDKIPFAILADGRFQERVEWMWDAKNETGEHVTHFTKDDWRDHCYQFLSRLAPDTLVTLIDYHP
jgi:hypothetical protein